MPLTVILALNAAHIQSIGDRAQRPDGQKFALVRQARVFYSLAHNTGSEKYGIRRQPQGDSGVEIYALGVG